MGVSENTLKRARNELKQKNLIDFKPANKKGESTTYRIIDLTNKVSNIDTKPDTKIDTQVKVSNIDTQIDTNADTKPDTKLDTKPDTQTDAINKLKYKLKLKYKHNEVVDDVDVKKASCQTEKVSNIDTQIDTKMTNDTLVKVVNLFEQSGMGTINATIAESLEYISNNYPYELIEEAFRRARLNHATSIRYVEKILLAWREKDIESLEQLMMYEKKKNKGGSKGAKSQFDNWGNDEQYEGIGISF
jgi:DnaD/phage-associated family protein